MPGHFKGCTTPDDCWCEAKRLVRVFSVTLAIFALEIIAGFLIGSLSLIADAFHVLSDNAAILVALAAAVIIKLGLAGNAPSIRTGALYVSIALLLITMTWVAVEAVSRLIDSHPTPPGLIVMGVALLGLMGNILQHRIHEEAPAEHRHRLHRSLSIHIQSDLQLSGGVIVGGALIALTGLPQIDPLITLGVVAWVFRETWKLVWGQSHHH